MFIEFNQLPPHARIWVYQSDRQLATEEATLVSEVFHSFCQQWEAHGQPLKTSFQLLLNQFLIVSVDEGFNNASGCSIDGSVRILKNFQAKNINFLDPSKIAFLVNDQVVLYSRLELKSVFASGVLSASTTTFNNLVSSKAEFENNWEVVVEKSWMAKYLPTSTLNM